MSIEQCYKGGKSDVSIVLLRAAELRRGKTIEEMSQSDGMKQAWKELKDYKKNTQ